MKLLATIIIFLSMTLSFSQTLDDSFSKRKMKKDLEVFKQIREKGNSGLYKYRTKQQIDSIYNWAFDRVSTIKDYKEFYALICILTDFEGSLHNGTYLPKKIHKNMTLEVSGYFPIPLKFIEGGWVVNTRDVEIPLGSEIISINEKPIEDVIESFYKYYTTDGFNKTGKSIGINRNFSRYYRYNFGLKEKFSVVYKTPNSNNHQTKEVRSIGYKSYYKNFKKRHSSKFDKFDYEDIPEKELYGYKTINNANAILTINSFSIGENEASLAHKKYVKFLDSIFTLIKNKNIENLIVDIRSNGGGTNPNDVVAYSYLADRNFKESKEVWSSFNKIPLLKYYNTSVPKFLRPFGIGKYNKAIQKRFPKFTNNKYYISNASYEMQLQNPNKNAFTGNVYLLISPRVASAGSLFAAMLAGQKNVTVIGEETMGGYFGHNGHSSLSYKLPNSKLVIDFSFENIEQYVLQRNNQLQNRGVMPDIKIGQNFSDFLNNQDTQLNYTLKLIEKREGFISEVQN